MSLVVLHLPATVAYSSDEHAHHRQMMTATQTLKISKEDYALPGIELVSHKGLSSAFHSFMSDADVIVNFIFTTCSAICPMQTATFSRLDEELKRKGINARLISISIDPEKDTPKQLARYARKFSASSRWIFLTGDKRDIINIQKAFNAFRGNKMNHEPITFIRKHKSPTWIRIEGFASAADILHEYRKQTTGD